MGARKRRKRERNIERYPLREDSVGAQLGLDWTFARQLARRRKRWPGLVGGLWIGQAAAHEHYRRYRARSRR